MQNNTRLSCLAFALAGLLLPGCALHQDGSGDIDVRAVGIKPQKSATEPVAHLAPQQESSGDAVGQVGSMGDSDIKSARVRDSANPEGDLRVEAARGPASIGGKGFGVKATDAPSTDDSARAAPAAK